MNSGQLDQRVTVERLQDGVDEIGQPSHHLDSLVHDMGRCAASDGP